MEERERISENKKVGNLIKTVETDYPTFHITMHVYWCEIVKGELTLLEHEAAKWLEIDSKLPTAVDWLPTDMEVILRYIFRRRVKKHSSPKNITRFF